MQLAQRTQKAAEPREHCGTYYDELVHPAQIGGGILILRAIFRAEFVGRS